ncbi:hypothetical protein GCM10010435_38050 [Winogradskya consettensis]|uniref:Uncharacterized protein n=1 Tax=Winogradskya consettensis TaxID=113560 RepID=A0A919T4A6_9ACTN|nr:hypothetical protein [Actinoplanes consettensis]GIM83749.1 hypothetical protein Aco04nite_88040 [Actinoplanes consettensis]
MAVIGAARDVDWLAGQTVPGRTVTTAIPRIFEDYATFERPAEVPIIDHERAVVAELTRYAGGQPWWLGFLETGAHDVVFGEAPRVLLYWEWPYVLVQGGPGEALTWRIGHMRDGGGALPDLFFPADRSWLVSALWDDDYSCVGGPAGLIESLQRNPSVNARRVTPDEEISHN